MKWQNNFKKSNLPRESLIDLTTFQVEKAKNELIENSKRGLRYDPDLNDFFDVVPKFAGTLALGKDIQVRNLNFF